MLIPLTLKPGLVPDVEPVTFEHEWYKLADREVIQAPCTMEAARLYIEAGYEDNSN